MKLGAVHKRLISSTCGGLAVTSVENLSTRYLRMKIWSKPEAVRTILVREEQLPYE